MNKVTIAVLRGLWDHLERPETWAVLAEAAQSPDRQILNGVARIPADRLTHTSRRRLIDLLAGLADYLDSIVRMAVLQRFVDLPLPDSEGKLLQNCRNWKSASRQPSIRTCVCWLSLPCSHRLAIISAGTKRAAAG